MEEQNRLEVLGARVHNLKNIDVTIPHRALTVITGLSGSGKSSLAFDTIFAEGQRRYIETFSSYARGFLGGMERPDVDKISGLSPVISIEQKTTNKNPRSTVGTTTEVYDFLRLLYARAAEAFSYETGERMVKYTEEQILELIMRDYGGCRVYLLAPLVRHRKGHYRELFESVRRKGYLYVRVDGEMREVVEGMMVDRYKNHDIEVVVDKLIAPSLTPDPSPVGRGGLDRLRASVATAMKLGEGLMMVYCLDNTPFPTGEGSGERLLRHYSRRLMCPTTGLSYRDPAPHNFSFNSPLGACPCCKGLGYVSLVDLDKVMPDRHLSVADGGIVPLGKAKKTSIFYQVEALLARHNCTLKTPLTDVPAEAIDEILHGTEDRLRIPAAQVGTSTDYFMHYDGLVKYIELTAEADQSAAAQKWVEQFKATAPCPECHGDRLNREALHFRIAGKNIAELCRMDIAELTEWVDGLLAECEGLSVKGEVLSVKYEDLTPQPSHLTPLQKKVAPEILKEISSRLHFLVDVGLEYLSLGRASMSLSGGESQRIRLATQIGSKLVGVLYILDEPSIGLHQRDNRRLIASLRRLVDAGNTVIVVEHDEEIMRQADWLIDIGPGAGRLGGEVVYAGAPLKRGWGGVSRTLAYLSGHDSIPTPSTRREGNGLHLVLKGATGNNLRSVTADFPLGTLICVTGVSGSGKSTLIGDTLQPLLSQHFFRSLRTPLPFDSVEGLDNIDKVIDVDQSPLGRTPRSNPATYTGVFTDIRALFIGLPEAKIRGYKPGRFSFNVKGGRCEACSGNGYKTIEMNFLPDVMVPCEECRGKRYNRETLEVRFKGKSIADVLDMTINQACEFFENQPAILSKIKVLQDVGLGYIRLGQPSTTLSGGESQRVKLATELARPSTGRTLYILDEPTTGLHFDDIKQLLGVLNRLVDKGNTVVVIEHNLDVIRCADHIIDLGPDGGRGGGRIVATGTPEQVAATGDGFTATYLREALEANKEVNNSAI